MQSRKTPPPETLPSAQLKGALGMVPAKEKDCFTTWDPLRSPRQG